MLPPTSYTASLPAALSQWCGPCRKFTPLFAVTYDDQVDKNEVEVRVWREWRVLVRSCVRIVGLRVRAQCTVQSTFDARLQLGVSALSILVFGVGVCPAHVAILLPEPFAACPSGVAGS